jgi:hypothetical protein
MYSPEAVARRRCTGTREDGAPCRAWAVWEGPRQLCVAHAGRHHTGPLPPPWEREREQPARCEACRCAAYQWPHRPGGGLCRWPEPPPYRLTTPAGTRAWPRARRPTGWPRVTAPRKRQEGEAGMLADRSGGPPTARAPGRAAGPSGARMAPAVGGPAGVTPARPRS